MKTMAERTILADCCEDWIIEWGGFYERGRSFRCPECSTEWTKAESEVYRRGDGREFVRRSRRGPDAEFPFLAAADGREPNVDRCCAKILLAHGERMADGPFNCPVCGTEWTDLFGAGLRAEFGDLHARSITEMVVSRARCRSMPCSERWE